MSDELTVDMAWNLVMQSVQAVGKGDFANVHGSGGFRFRGVDAVVNAVGPALREFGVTVLPKRVLSVETTEYPTRSGGRMVNRLAHIEWEVRGPQGDSFTGESYGEAADAGDKSMSKAMSVGYRVFLLQSLCIPTDEPDPDLNVHERAAQPQEQAVERQSMGEVDEANKAKDRLLAALQPHGWTEEKLVRRYWDDYRKNLRNTLDVAMIDQFRQVLLDEVKVENAQPAMSPQRAAVEAAKAKMDAAMGKTEEDQMMQEVVDAEVVETAVQEPED